MYVSADHPGTQLDLLVVEKSVGQRVHEQHPEHPHAWKLQIVATDPAEYLLVLRVQAF